MVEPSQPDESEIKVADALPGIKICDFICFPKFGMITLEDNKVTNWGGEWKVESNFKFNVKLQTSCGGTKKYKSRRL